MEMARSSAESPRKLSTLEQTVLGIVWLRGPCTIYAVMRELESSESSYHRSRASTAYSVAKRLTGFGLIEPESGGEASVQITAVGKEALMAWLTPPVPMADVAHSADLLRLRFFFLGALPPEARLRFIDEAIISLEDLSLRAEGLVEQNEQIGEYFGALATVSMVLETQARIQWLRLARKWVMLDPAPGYAERLRLAVREIRFQKPGI